MDLTKVLFRPHRGGLVEALREVVVFDNQFQLVDYIFSIYHIVPRFEYYGFDERIGWNTFIVLCRDTNLPFGFAHFPID